MIGNQPMIRLEDVHLTMRSAERDVNILRGIDLTVDAGEAVALVGPSGSGKSTMIMVIAGLETPTGGAVRIAGTDFSGLGEDALALFRRDNIGIVFQNFHLVPTMTALENVAIPLEFAGRSDAFDRAREGLEAVGLGPRTGHYPGQLSGGEQQRVALARALVTQPALLFADELTGNLDEATGDKIFALLQRLHRTHGLTSLIATHNLKLAEQCDRVVRLEKGRLAPVPV